MPPLGEKPPSSQVEDQESNSDLIEGKVKRFKFL